MRQVGDLTERALAHRFLSYMVAQGVQGEAREDENGHFRVWVYDEDDLEKCLEWFEDFLANSQDSRFDAPRVSFSSPADSATPHPLTEAAAKRPAKSLTLASAEAAIPVTTTLIGISIIVTAVRLYMPSLAPLTRYLHFSEQIFSRNFPEILSGEVWRLVTPIFLHGNLWHILFNMLWLFQLGSTIERLEGSKHLLRMTLALAVVCDVAQYLVSGPAFLGMSGVVYGLLGYIWIMGRKAPRSGYILSEQTFVFMIIWMVLCLVGIIPDVANTQHVVGLVCGLLWGTRRARQA